MLANENVKLSRDSVLQSRQKLNKDDENCLSPAMKNLNLNITQNNSNAKTNTTSVPSN